MMKDIFNKNLILASKSPRRSQLLEEAGFSFEIKVNDVEETFPDDLPVEEVAEFLAIKKANASREFIVTDEIVIAADCIVTMENVIYGKPKDLQEAKDVLRILSGKSHKVITGVCLMSKDKTESFSGVSKVFMAEMSDAEIDYYVEKFKPFDKAGSYAIQEWIGLCRIEKIEGTYSNIMGLPIHLVYENLKNF